MNQNANKRLKTVPPINSQVTTNNRTKLKWQNLMALFFIQFLFSPIIFSYGMYTLNFVQHGHPFTEALWSPAIFLTSTKILGPVCRDLAERYNESYFRPFFILGVLMCSFGISICTICDSFFLNGLIYGIFGGFGFNLIMNFVECYMLDIFPYQTQTVLGVQQLGIGVGLFLMPHIIKLMFHMVDSSAHTFLTHGALLLNGLSFAILLKRPKIIANQSLTAYNNVSVNECFGEEMIYMTNIDLNNANNRSWKSPSDHMNANHNDSDDDNTESDENCPSPLVQHKTNMGVNVLPQIVEEDEDTDDDAKLGSKRNSLLTNNIKRMSVINFKLEELIVRNDEDLSSDANCSKYEEVSLDTEKTEHLPRDPAGNNVQNVCMLETRNVQSNVWCCTPYRKYFCQTKIKCVGHFIKDMAITPLNVSLQVIEFYPALLTTIQSMLSPLIFLNLIAFQPQRKKLNTSLTDLAFMFSITGFAYLVFLITLPWITEISKRNLKYFYMTSSVISAGGIYLLMKTDTDDFRTLSCLLYGFAFGLESYVKEIILKESVGVMNWSVVEGTLECLSGILFFVAIFIVNIMFGVHEMTVSECSEIWLNIIMYTHLSIFCIWVLFLLVNTLRKRNRDSNY